MQRTAAFSFLVLLCASTLAAEKPCPPGVLSEELKHVLSFDNPELRQGFVARAQRGSLGELKDAVADLKQTVNPEVNHPEIPRGIYAFESDVQRLFRLAPEHRDLKAFAENWKLSEKDLLDVLTYYGTQVFYNDVRVAGDPSVVFSRLQTVSFQHYLRFSDSPTAKHFGYYMTHIPQKSVPEMALELGLTEGRVYEELSQLRISLVQAFESDPARAGAQARRFMEHHLRDSSRGVRWNRVGTLNGERLLEEEILVRLFEDERSAPEISEALNEIFPAGATHLDLRTEASVRAKLSELGLTQPTARLGEATVFDPEYGYLKLSGRLVEASATRFLFEHYDREPAWLAARLGVTVETLRDFETRNHIIREPGAAKGVRVRPRIANTETQALLDGFEEQRTVVDKVVDWIEKNGRVPTGRELKAQIGAAAVNRLKGEGDYRPGGPQSDFQYFENSGAAWLAIHRRAAARGVTFDIRKVRIEKSERPSYQEFVQVVREDVLRASVASVEKRGAAITMNKLSKDIGIGESRLLRGNLYSGKEAIFDGTEEFVLTLGERCQQQGIKWSYFWFHAVEPGLRWTSLRRHELIKATLEVYQSKRLPADQFSVANLSKVLNMSAEQFTGRLQALGLDTSAFWIAVHDEGVKREIPFSFLDLPKIDKLSQELRLRMIQEFRSRLRAWFARNRRQPKVKDYERNWPEGLGANYHKVFAKSDYAPGARNASAALFSSPEEAMQFYNDELKLAGILEE